MLIEDKYNILEIFKKNKGSVTAQQLADTIMECLKKEILSEADLTLLNLVFTPNPTQKDLDNCLERWDIEAVGAHKALLLSYFMKLHPNLSYPTYVAPRLKGLLDFYRFQNIKLISHYTKICNELKKANIIPLIFKGGCMKYLRPQFSRVMGDIDILVDKKHWRECGEIAQNMGYDVCWDIHSIDIHPQNSQDGIMDIHKYIIMDTPDEKTILKDLFKRATIQKVFGIETLVPCNEDLFFILLINMVRNLMNKTSCAGVLYNLFDCKFLLDSKPDFDWNIVLQNIKKTKTQSQAYFAVKFLNSIVPNLLPEKVLVGSYLEREFKNYCIRLIYQRFFIWNMKQKCRKMKIKDLFSSWEFFKNYMAIKPKYFILKTRIFRKNPYLAEKILKREQMYEN